VYISYLQLYFVEICMINNSSAQEVRILLIMLHAVCEACEEL